MFAPTERDFTEGITLFTGEKMRSGGGTAHVLGEEACRALILLDVKDREVRAALERATAGMLARLTPAAPTASKTGREWSGQYCCGTCTVALWRHLAVGGLDHSEERLTAGLKALKLHRTGNGKWRPFPFWYTLLALSEMYHSLAIEEMQYAAPLCEQYLKRSPGDNPFAQRHHLVCERVMAKC